MKRTILIAVSIIMIASLSSCHKGKAPAELKTKNDTISWVMGESLARSLHNVDFDVDIELARKAFEATINGEKQPIDDDTYKMVYEYINFMVMQNARNKQQQQMENNQKSESEYFAQLEKKAGIKKSDKGFYYEVIKSGNGPKAQFAQRIKFDYRSFFMISGESYDQTYGVREPIITTVGNQLIPGLREGMQLMQAGSIYRFYLPSKMAYGAKGSGQIPPFTPMIYEVELHELFND